MNKPEFKQIPIKDLTVSLEDFQGRTEAYSSTTYNRILNEVKEGIFNFSALPAIMVWKDNRTGKWVILGGHSRTAAFTELSQGNQPMDPKYKPSDFNTIAAQIFVADSYEDALEQAKKVAQESNLAGQQSDIDFAFKVVAPLRASSANPTKYWEKMDDLFGGNKMTVHKLSFLNPDGKAVSMLKATKNLSDRQQKATVETIATYIGKARERMPELTNAHENELYDWLTRVFAEDAKAKKEGRQLNSQVSTETKFLDLIGSRVMRLGWTPDQPLNLDLVGTKSTYQTTFDETKAEKEKQIKDLQQAYNDERMKLIKLNWPSDKIEEKLQQQELYIIRLQRELAAYLQTSSAVQEATKNELNLFDVAAPPMAEPRKTDSCFNCGQPLNAGEAKYHTDCKPQEIDTPSAYTEKLGKLLGVLRLAGVKRPNTAWESNVAALSDPKTGLGAVVGKIVEEQQPYKDSFLKERGLTIEKYRALDKKGKDKIQQDWIKSKEFKDLEHREDKPEFKSSTLQKAAKSGRFKFDYLLNAPKGDFLLGQLDYWLMEFEQRTLDGDTRYRQYKYDGEKYEPHIIHQKTGYEDDDMLKQICETAIHIYADQIIENAGSIETAYDDLVSFYKVQPKVEWRSSKSMRLQQYSTPVPLSYLMSKFCIEAPQPEQKFLEPSAGTGLLTIGTNPARWTINEIDKDRLLCMKFMGFENTYSLDGSQPLPFPKDFDAIMTNPPFGAFPVTDFRGYKLRKKEHVMAAYALNCMKDDGKAAIIIGDYMNYDKEGLIAPFASDRIFFNYLYRYYNVVDVISLEGNFYLNMGAAAPIRIILIDGAFPEGRQVLPPSLDKINELPSDTPTSPHKVKNWETFLHRMLALIK